MNNTENNQPSAYIKLFKDGHVEVTGGLTFHSQESSVWIEIDNPGSGHKVQYNTLITHSPKWWELRKWWSIIKLIRGYTK